MSSPPPGRAVIVHQFSDDLFYSSPYHLQSTFFSRHLQQLYLYPFYLALAGVTRPLHQHI